MAACDATGARIPLYVDGELHDRELKEFESHLRACPACQMAIAGRRRFLSDLSSARPLDVAPPALRLRVENILADAMAQPNPRTQVARPRDLKQRWSRTLSGFRWAVPQAALAAMLLVAVAGGLWLERQSGRPPRSAFASAALEAHKHRLQGGLRLDMRSSSPEAISAWFQRNTTLHVNLPQNQDLPSQQPYQLEGAGIEAFRGGQMGYIAYRVGTKPVSLLVVPASAVTLDGRKQVPMKSLVIHYDEAGGYHIVTWAVPRKGVTYALVSESSQHPNQSCIVCHAGPKDQAFMHTLLSQ